MNNKVESKRNLQVEQGVNFFSVLKGMLFCLMLLQASLAVAGEAFPDQFSLRLGGYRIQGADTIVRLDANNVPVGGYINFHDTLGGETSATVFRADGLFRFNDRHAVGFSWYNIAFNGSTVLGRDITWGGIVYPASTFVESKLKFDVYKLNYQYSLFHNDTAELGGLIGLHVMKISMGLNAAAISESYTEKVTAPLPVFGLFANYNFTPRFSLFYNYQFFSVDYDNTIKGGLQDFLFGLEYRIMRNIALGAAYNRFAVNLEAKKTDTTFFADSSWNGGMLYATLYF